MYKNVAFGGMLDGYMGAHNFTFDTQYVLPQATDDFLSQGKGILAFGAQIYSRFGPSYNGYVSSRVLYHFHHFTTIWFSKPTQPEPFKLSSLAAPLMNDKIENSIAGFRGLVRLPHTDFDENSGQMHLY